VWCIKSVVLLVINNEQKIEPFVVSLSSELEQIREVCEPLLYDLGFELVWLKAGAFERGGILSVFIDKYGDALIALDEIEKMSRLLGDVLDLKLADFPFLNHKYHLEVSSPGIERPLSRRSHFEEACEQQVQIKCVPGAGVGVSKLLGTLTQVRDDGISVLSTDLKEYKIEWKAISFAHKVWSPARFSKAKAKK